MAYTNGRINHYKGSPIPMRWNHATAIPKSAAKARQKKNVLEKSGERHHWSEVCVLTLSISSTSSWQINATQKLQSSLDGCVKAISFACHPITQLTCTLTSNTFVISGSARLFIYSSSLSSSSSPFSSSRCVATREKEGYYSSRHHYLIKQARV